MSQTGSWAVGLGGIGLGLVAGLLLLPRGEPVNPQIRALDADLWVQTAAEYRACCLQAYNLATLRVRNRVNDAKRDPARPLAVVLDLDETVLDNGGYQSFLIEQGQDYSDATWRRWANDHADRVQLVPGAKEFLAECARLKVVPVFITNRAPEEREGTLRSLKGNGVDLTDIDARLFLKTGKSDKTERRKEAAKSRDVFLWIGDNLRDMDERFAFDPKLATDRAGREGQIEQRLQQVEKTREKWGEEWILLPNPMYGEWRNLLGPKPAEFLRPSGMKAR